jgi:predicted acetyltransferase
MPLYSFRAITPDEWPAFKRRVADVFGDVPTPTSLTAPSDEVISRAFAAFDSDGTIVATGHNLSQRLTMPGGTQVPVGGVSAVTVHQLHRRQGLLNRLMQVLIADARAHGEFASILTASEGSIYWKQGFGPATWAISGDIARGSRLVTSPDAAPAAIASGTLHQISDVEEARSLLAEIHELACRAHSGAVTRPPHDWAAFLEYVTENNAHWRVVVHQGADGVLDGYAAYGMKGDWTPQSRSEMYVALHDLQWASIEAHRALWTHLLDIDLAVGVRGYRLAADDPIRLMLEDVRGFRITGLLDRLWIRPLDPVALLESRPINPGPAVVVDWHDGDGAVQRLSISEKGVVPASGEPDLILPTGALGAVVLGGTSAAALALAGRLSEVHPGAGAALDRLLSAPSPQMTTSF